MCFERIDARAKKCPHCSSVQAKWANVEGNPWLAAILFLMVLWLVGSIFMTFWSFESFDDHSGELLVSVSRVDVDESNESATVSCLGTIDNRSTTDWTDVRFEVLLHDRSGKVIDTFSAGDNGLLLPRGTQTSFRVHGRAALPKTEYETCEVKIKRASIAR